MLYKDETLANGDRLLLWKMEESADELLSRFTSLREVYAADVSSYKSPKRVQEYLSVRMLLRIALGHEARIDHDQSGKPFLPDEPDVRISISHTKNYAALFVSHHREVGVDIEQMSDRILRVKSKFLCERELSLIDEMDKTQLLLCWSAKEALYKLIPGLRPEYWEQLFLTGIDFSLRTMTFDTNIGSVSLAFRVEEDFVLVYN